MGESERRKKNGGENNMQTYTSICFPDHSALTKPWGRHMSYSLRELLAWREMREGDIEGQRQKKKSSHAVSYVRHALFDSIHINVTERRLNSSFHAPGGKSHFCYPIMLVIINRNHVDTHLLRWICFGSVRSGKKYHFRQISEKLIENILIFGASRYLHNYFSAWSGYNWRATTGTPPPSDLGFLPDFIFSVLRELSAHDKTGKRGNSFADCRRWQYCDMMIRMCIPWLLIPLFVNDSSQRIPDSARIRRVDVCPSRHASCNLFFISTTAWTLYDQAYAAHQHSFSALCASLYSDAITAIHNDHVRAHFFLEKSIFVHSSLYEI